MPVLPFKALGQDFPQTPFAMVAKGGQQARGTHTKKGTRSAPKFQHLPTQRGSFHILDICLKARL